MTDQQLVSFIRDYLSRGYSEEQIFVNLSNTGWSEKDLKEAFAEIRTTPVEPASAVIVGSSSPQAVSISVLAAAPKRRRLDVEPEVLWIACALLGVVFLFAAIAFLLWN